MRITEYRIPFPATVQEYRVGMLYMIARASEEEARRAGGRGAVEVVRNEMYTHNDHGLDAGVYTEKIYHMERFVPKFVRALVPSTKCKVIEKSWVSYPQRCITLYYCPYFGRDWFLSIESHYAENDRGEQWNALGLTGTELRNRQIITLDIASENCVSMSPEADVREFHTPEGGGRGILQAGVWIRSSEPIMCCYKVCRLDISGHKRVEQWGERFIRNSFIRYHRLALVWMDSWLGAGLRDIPGALPVDTQMSSRTDWQADMSHSTDDAIPLTQSQAPSQSQEHHFHRASQLVATELATDAVGLAAAAVFAKADESNPFA